MIPYWIPLLSPARERLFLLSLVPWAFCLVVFTGWWAIPSHHISVLGSAIASALTFFEVLMPAYLYFFLLRSRVVNQSITPDPSWRLAMVVTKAPSEPWPLVRRTLEAMLTQDLAHDTWLADEDPDEETRQWCESHGVRISTRQGVKAYHQPSWPRRTRCKEGNLAYFYDHYGYDQYDIVAQLDADHVPATDYLHQVCKPFVDPGVGYVAAPSICDANASQSWSARGRLYAEAILHGPLQCGYNDGWAPLCIGSHYCVRTSALKEIGGLGPELAEDHSTTLLMNAKGWNGVFQPDAIAHGDGPATFLDCMMQEYQWSRSLSMILLQLTPQFFGKLSARKRFQFIFTQIWYLLFSSAAVIGFLIPVLCLVLNVPMLRMGYLPFLCLPVCSHSPICCQRRCCSAKGSSDPGMHPSFRGKPPCSLWRGFPSSSLASSMASCLWRRPANSISALLPRAITGRLPYRSERFSPMP